MNIENETKNKPQQRLSLWQVVISTFAAAFGVQSKKNHENDFAKGSVVTYIIAGVLFTLLFVATIAILVSQIA